MQLRPIEDDHEAEYWARQIRLGAGVAVALTLLGCLRVYADWDPAYLWALLPLGAAVAVQAGTLRLPWARLVRRPRLRGPLFAWWVAEVPALTIFGLADPAGPVLYLPGAMLIVFLAAALYPPRAVLSLGAVTVAGYLVIAGQRDQESLALTVGLCSILLIMIGLCAVTAANRNRQEDRRRSAERRTEALLENSSDAVLAIDRDGEVRYASPSVRGMLGHDREWLTGAHLAEMVHPEDLPLAREWMASLVTAPAGQRARIEARLRRADGAWVYVDAIGSNRTDDPDLNAAVISIRDIGQRRALEDELTRQAFADSLTGLANRALFHDRVDHAVARHGRDGGRVTVLLIDLDDFKVVNDSLGHSAGDKLLTTVADRLRRHVRPSDTLARLGGDEFAVLVEDLDELATAALAERILLEVRRPVRLATRDVVCTMSIGIAAAKAGDETDTDELLRYADLAMYAAKKAGRDRYAVFDPAMYVDVLREARQRADMEQALSGGQFVVHYQPIVDLPRRQLTGVEALVRWQHPTEGLLGPNSFIGLAEDTGLIVPLGRWVLQQACDQLARWGRDWPTARHLRMSVNLSARQFQYVGLVDDVEQAVAGSGIDPGQLILEITESMLMQDTEATIETLGRLRGLGVRLAIDDFGTGYSSLSYLKRFPVDILKIDRSFVGGVDVDRADATLAEAVVGLGRALDLQTVAEGIETDDQWAALRELGCDYGQGFLFARPVGAPEIEALLADPAGALR